MTESYETSNSYSDSNHPFDFHAEPEPEPPALANGSDGSKSSTPDGTSNTADSSDSATKAPEKERTWTSLTVPGAILNSTVYIIGKTIELLAPYWPNSEQRQKVQSLAQAHPVLTSFLFIQVMFVLVPVLGFAAFVVGMTVVVVGGAVLFVVSAGLGVGVMVFIPGVLAAAGWAGVVWSWAYLWFRAIRVAWGMYKSSSYYRALSQEHKEEESKKLNGSDKKQLEEKSKKAKGMEPAYRQGDYLSADEEKRPTSANSLASSTVKVEGGDREEARFSDDDYGRAVKQECARVSDGGDRDEDRVLRDILRSLG
ncbi:hypothetical protein BGX38DRAFT_1175572 [Terfezia claveryi]|nr:hypothetical protein BGX38DRAFT_1175572 [Terfezia claveryi]